MKISDPGRPPFCHPHDAVNMESHRCLRPRLPLLARALPRPSARLPGAAARLPRAPVRRASGPFGYVMAKALVYSKHGDPNKVLR